MEEAMEGRRGILSGDLPMRVHLLSSISLPIEQYAVSSRFDVGGSSTLMSPSDCGMAVGICNMTMCLYHYKNSGSRHCRISDSFMECART